MNSAGVGGKVHSRCHHVGREPHSSSLQKYVHGEQRSHKASLRGFRSQTSSTRRFIGYVLYRTGTMIPSRVRRQT
jgi:hypothetical protein